MQRIAKFSKVSWEQFKKDWIDTFGDVTEEKIKEETKATIRCIPFETFLDDDKEPGTCMVTGKPSACRALFARSY